MAEQLQSEQTLPPGLRVLVVEDMWLVAEDLAMELEDMGCHVAGPAGRLEQGLAIAQAETLDGALLDVNLGVDNSFPIATELKARGVPFVFLTGYDMSEAFPPDLVDVPRLRKPINPRDLTSALARFAENPD